MGVPFSQRCLPVPWTFRSARRFIPWASGTIAVRQRNAWRPILAVTCSLSPQELPTEGHHMRVLIVAALSWPALLVAQEAVRQQSLPQIEEWRKQQVVDVAAYHDERGKS